MNTSWQTMETAPKDRHILLAIPVNTRMIGIWDIHSNNFIDQNGFPIEIPTHWHELPELPD